MKKLMFAAAVMAVGAAMAVESQIVGYNTPNAFRTGNTLFGPMFIKVGTQSATSQGQFNICSLVPTAVDDVAGGRTGKVPTGQAGITTAISLQKLTATGGQDGQKLYWLDYHRAAGGPVKEWDFHGWYTTTSGTPAPVTEMMIDAGKAVWINMPSDACCTFTVNGEVVDGEIYFPLAKGNTAVCNPQAADLTTDVANGGIYPFAVDPADIPTGQSGITTAISIQKLTATGGQEGQKLYWLNYHRAAGGPVKEWDFHGWYSTTSGTPAPVTDYTIAPGQGLWVNNPANDKCSLCFPSVLAK